MLGQYFNRMPFQPTSEALMWDQLPNDCLDQTVSYRRLVLKTPNAT